MKKLIFSRILKSKKDLKWDWSGTVTSLHKHLEEKITIENMYYFWGKRIYLREILRKLRLLKDDTSMYNIKLANKSLKKYNYDKSPVLQFDEFPYFEDGNHFIYQDLSVLYLKELAETDQNLFKYSGFKNHSIKNITKRANSQLDFYKHCNGIFTMGHWLKKYLTDTNLIDSSKIHHVGGGVNIDISKIDYSKKENNKILFVGKDFERKGGMLVVESFQYLSKNINIDAELYIIGPKTIDIKYDNDNIHFIGEVSPKELHHYFNICDVFCMPSYFEAYGLVFIEALCFGLPCIGRNCFEMPYFIDDNFTGYLINNDDIVDLAEKMNDLLTNTTIKNNVKNLKNNYIQEYSWDTVTNKILNIMEENLVHKGE